MRRILLLNPPGERRYLRDYYCSKVSKGSYINHPVDLLMQSAHLRSDDEIRLIDAIVSPRSLTDTLNEIAAFNPDIIITLVAAVSWKEDVRFIGLLRERLPRTLIAASGDALMDRPQILLKSELKALDAILLDLTENDVNRLWDGAFDEISHMVYKLPLFRDLPQENPQLHLQEIHSADHAAPKTQVSHSVGVPRHELFLTQPYSYPFVRSKHFATMLTDFGCVYQCTFCIMSTLSFRLRPLEEIAKELLSLQDQGIREIYFADQTFGAHRERTLKLCELLKDAHMGWVCFGRVDRVDDELLSTMKSSGCHTIMFGVETDDNRLLRQLKKNTKTEQVRSALTRCRNLGIRTVGTFLVGLPEQDEADIRRIYRFARELPLDFASFNIAVPRSLTKLRSEMLDEGLTDPDQRQMDQSGWSSGMITSRINPKTLQRLHAQGVLAFYLRPAYLLRRLRQICTPYDATSLIMNALSLLRGSITSLFHHYSPYRGAPFIPEEKKSPSTSRETKPKNLFYS